MKLKRTYGSREVASLTGLTARQLQLWDQSGLVSAAIPPHKTDAGGYTERRYTPIELFELLVLADLRRRGFTVHQLHLILETLKHRCGAGIRRGFHRPDVASHDRCHQTRIDFLPADKDDVGRLAHRVGGFDHADQAARLDHAERVADFAFGFVFFLVSH